ncbi:MAG TPA: RDD family protein [Lysobacter sp.]
MSDWYYSDYERNRLGPVAARDLADLHHAGQLQPDTLVWREGMPQWRAWREVMTQALNEAAGIASPAMEAMPLSAGVNPYAMAEPVPSAASAQTSAHASTAPSLGTLSSTSTLSAGTNPYAVAEPHSPYAPPRAAVENFSYAAEGHVVYAGFWKRTAAYIIDSIVLGIAGAILGAVVGGLLGAGGTGDLAIQAVAQILGLLLGASYFGFMHSMGDQASLGKMAVGIKVVNDEGRPISFMRGFGRYFGLILSSLLLSVGLIMAAFTDRKRALHDMVCSTLVVDRWAFTNHPERQREELGTVVIVVLIIGGILALAAIAAVGLAVMALVSMGGGR